MVSKEALDANRTNPCRDDKAKRLPKTPPPESAVWGQRPNAFGQRSDSSLGRRSPPHSGPVFMGQRRRRYQGWKILPSRNEARTWSWLGINQASNWTLLRREGGGENFPFFFVSWE